MDPLIFCGLCGVVSAGVGFVAGSALFKSLWRVMNKDIGQKMLEVPPVGIFFIDLPLKQINSQISSLP